MTNKKIAQLAGVSPATVSKILSGSDEISPATAERVLRVIEENGWTPPKYRRTASARGSLRAAILVPEIVSEYYSVIATSAAEALATEEIETEIRIAGFTREEQHALLRRLIGDGLTDGILAVDMWEYTAPAPIPIVMQNRIPDSDEDTILRTSGFPDAIRYLRSLGHTRIGFIGEKNTVTKQRYFQLAMEQQGLPLREEWLFSCTLRFAEIGFEAVRWFLSRKKEDPAFRLPTAFLTAYDEVALGVIRALLDAGCSVPRDFSVIGMNDVSAAAFAGVRLTTIRTDSCEVAAANAHLLAQRIRTPSAPLACGFGSRGSLVVRDSTAAPRPNDIPGNSASDES